MLSPSVARRDFFSPELKIGSAFEIEACFYERDFSAEILSTMRTTLGCWVVFFFPCNRNQADQLHRQALSD